MKRNKLASYSSAAFGFLLLHKEAEAQVIYTDVDPDAYVSVLDPMEIDLNADGIPEITFNQWSFFTFSSFGGGSWGYRIRNIKATNFESVAVNLIHTSGSEINSGISFTDYFVRSLFYGTSFIPFGIDTSIGSEDINLESFLGIRFHIGTETHYGWVRLSVEKSDPNELPLLRILDYAYNATPDEGILTVQNSASIPHYVVLSDIANTGTGADLQFSFEKAMDESRVSAYHIFFVPGITPLPTIAEAESLAPDRYIEVTPSGENITLSCTESTVDINGDILVPGTSYRAMVLSMADGVLASVNALSNASNFASFVEVAAPTPEATLFVDHIHADISAFSVRYENVETGADSIQVYICDDNTFSVSDLQILDAAYFSYGSVEPGIQWAFPEVGDQIYAVDEAKLFNTYYGALLSSPDELNCSLPSLVFTEGAPLLYPYINVAPDVWVSDSTGHPTDVHVHFPMFNNEAMLDEYQFAFVPDGEGLLQEDVASLTVYQVMHIEKSGTDIDMYLPNNARDTHLTVLHPGPVYNLYVILKGDTDPVYYTVSDPSVTFSLSDPDVMSVEQPEENISLIFSSDGFFVHMQADQMANLSVFTLSGELLRHENLKGTSHISGADFPSGMYLVQVRTGRECITGKWINGLP